ncbi:membrane protein [Coemansia reversa NRRL 1564]|uniref:Membrane protein n=1 Tax=Coemansia reversa (strain ATCC 12441 / NRRL 1564) TaxID=763665 RepID=A0A2G5BE60_COERN|nr:membrane protein [Coemansia reversa NRRL 1564]|eukprot:PIA16997.1 membrane protein [Coemansia reversa NRRL 1564]
MAIGHRILPLCAAALLAGAQSAWAHDHHGANMNFNTGEPIGAILKVHIILMSLSFGLFFPIGLVLGLKKNRWHVPVQTTGGVLAIIGFVLGHAHGGRAFPDNAHSKFSWFMLWLLVAQLSAGGYLKAHTERRFNDKARPYIKIAHKYMAILMIIVSYVQILLGVIAYLGYCYNGYFGQCLAHLIMGSAFMAYGVWLLLLLRLASPWLNRFGRSPELYDSVMITVWGLINTFTEHGFIEEADGWSHKDLQHTSLGVIWFCGGLLSTYMLRKAGPYDRSMFPAIILIFTGCAMGSHEQDTEFSTRVHFIFGLSLVLAGFTRCLEILLITTNLIRPDSKEPNPFQYLPVFFLCHSGMMFMSANHESVHDIEGIGIDIGTYSLGYLSISFLIFLYAYFLFQLFSELGKHQNKDATLPSSEDGIAYHTVTQVSEVRSISEEDLRGDPHVLFDADAEDAYDSHESDAHGVYQRAGTANGSPRSSDVIELGPMSRI